MRLRIPIEAAPWIAVLLGLLFLGYGSWKVMDGLETASWTHTTGTVESADIERHVRRSGSRSTRRTAYVARVVYTYEASGAIQRSDRVEIGGSEARGQGLVRSRGGGMGTRDEARWVVDRFPAGARVDVWYDPEDPTSSVLIRGAGPYAWISVMLGVFLCIGGALAYAFAGAMRGDDEELLEGG